MNGEQTVAEPRGAKVGHTDRNARLDSLRGLAAMIVAAFHCGQTRVAPVDSAPMLAFGFDSQGIASWLGWIYGWILNGPGAVVLFFVLSGHVLGLSLNRSTGNVPTLTVAFLARRAIRLLPPVAAMVGLFAAVSMVTGYRLTGAETYEPANLLKNAVLLGSPINGVVWTLRIEFVAAPLILALWLLRRRFGSGALLAATAALLVLSFDRSLSRWTTAQGLLPIDFLVFAYALGAGLLVRDLVGLLDARGVPVRPSLVAVSGASLILAAPHLFSLGSAMRVLTETTGSMMLVAAAGALLDGRPAGLLDHPWVRFYGRISYSFYLLHPLTLTVLWVDRPLVAPLLEAGLPGFAVAFVAFLITTAAITPFAWLCNVIVERPSMRMASRIGKARVPGFRNARQPVRGETA